MKRQSEGEDDKEKDAGAPVFVELFDNPVYDNGENTLTKDGTELKKGDEGGLLIVEGQTFGFDETVAEDLGMEQAK